MDQIGERLSALTPDNADPQAVADGAAEVSERVRIEFAKRIGMGDLLEARVRR